MYVCSYELEVNSGGGVVRPPEVLHRIMVFIVFDTYVRG